MSDSGRDRTVRLADLARDLDVDYRTLRGWVTRTFPRTASDVWRPRGLVPKQVQAARAHFSRRDLIADGSSSTAGGAEHGFNADWLSRLARPRGQPLGLAVVFVPDHPSERLSWAHGARFAATSVGPARSGPGRPGRVPSRERSGAPGAEPGAVVVMPVAAYMRLICDPPVRPTAMVSGLSGAAQQRDAPEGGEQRGGH